MKKVLLFFVICFVGSITISVISLQQKGATSIPFAEEPGDWYSKTAQCKPDPGKVAICYSIICCQEGSGTCTMSQLCMPDCSTEETCGPDIPIPD